MNAAVSLHQQRKIKSYGNNTNIYQEHEAELRRIATLNVFASKIAQTILSKDIYRASPKQVDILNEVSEITFYISHDYATAIQEKHQENQRRLMYL